MLTSAVGQHPNNKISIDVSIAFYDIFNILETQISGGGGGCLTQINHKRDIENDLKIDITPVILGHNWDYHTRSAIVRDKIGQHSGTTD